MLPSDFSPACPLPAPSHAPAHPCAPTALLAWQACARSRAPSVHRRDGLQRLRIRARAGHLSTPPGLRKPSPFSANPVISSTPTLPCYSSFPTLPSFPAHQSDRFSPTHLSYLPAPLYPQAPFEHTPWFASHSAPRPRLGPRSCRLDFIAAAPSPCSSRGSPPPVSLKRPPVLVAAHPSSSCDLSPEPPPLIILMRLLTNSDSACRGREELRGNEGAVLAQRLHAARSFWICLRAMGVLSSSSHRTALKKLTSRARACGGGGRPPSHRIHLEADCKAGFASFRLVHRSRLDLNCLCRASDERR